MERQESERKMAENKRFKDQVMNSVQIYREGEDLEGYLEVVEGSCKKAALPIDK